MWDDLKVIGSICVQQRKARGWTQADAAKRANLPRPTISMIENGRFNGSLKVLLAYLITLNLKLVTTSKSPFPPQLDELHELFSDD